MTLVVANYETNAKVRGERNRASSLPRRGVRPRRNGRNWDESRNWGSGVDRMRMPDRRRRCSRAEIPRPSDLSRENGQNGEIGFPRRWPRILHVS